ncbi:MAG: DUF6468 domain-containing protein [Pseudomonadota bacterium]
MNLILTYAADVLMILASLGAATYCLVLSRRLSRLTSFDKGIGGAIAVLSAQVDDMKSALAEAKTGSDGAGQQLHDLVRQARDISSELELMIASCHDFAEEALIVQSGTAPDPVAEEPDIPVEAEPSPDPEPVEEPSADIPVFGSRRAAPLAPVFQHRAAAGAAT